VKTNSKGFTLIELLVVIAIIGILSTIAMTSLNGARKKAADASFKSSVSSLQAIGVLCCDSGVTNPLTAAPAASGLVCIASSGVTGNYPPSSAVGALSIAQCNAGDFEIIAQKPTGFSGTLSTGGCNATTCGFCTVVAPATTCDPLP